MPGQICDKSGVLAASLVHEGGNEGESTERLGKLGHGQSGDCIQEEEGEGEVEGRKEGEEGRIDEGMSGPHTTVPPSGHFSWRVDLASSEPYWAGWFAGTNKY